MKKNSSNSSSSSKYGGNSDGPPPIATNLSRYNFAKETYGTIGGPPINLLAGIFAKLMNGSYFYAVSCHRPCAPTLERHLPRRGGDNQTA